MDKKFTHTVILITYNQEHCIERAISSILSQDYLPDEVVLSDDCSSDATVARAQMLMIDYPGTFRVLTCKKNKGVFGNINSILECSASTGEIVHWLAGDDELAPNLIRNVDISINQNRINPLTDRVLLLPNLVISYGGKSELRKTNLKLVNKAYKPISASLREKGNVCMVGLTRALFEVYPRYPEECDSIGPWGDYLHFIILSSRVTRFLPVDFDGIIYYYATGVSSKCININKSKFLAVKAVYNHVKKGLIFLDERDLSYLRFKLQAVARRSGLNKANDEDLFWSYVSHNHKFSGDALLMAKELVIALLPKRNLVAMQGMRYSLPYIWFYCMINEAYRAVKRSLSSG